MIFEGYIFYQCAWFSTAISFNDAQHWDVRQVRSSRQRGCHPESSNLCFILSESINRHIALRKNFKAECSESVNWSSHGTPNRSIWSFVNIKTNLASNEDCGTEILISSHLTFTILFENFEPFEISGGENWWRKIVVMFCYARTEMALMPSMTDRFQWWEKFVRFPWCYSTSLF